MVRLFERAAETMKNATQFARVWTHDFQRVFPCVALMDHHVEPQFHRQVELLLKQTHLFRFVCAVANLRFDFFIGLSSQCGHDLDLLFLRYFFTRQMVIIETCLADGYDARALCQFAQRRDHIVLSFFNVSRVNADHREDGRVFSCKLDRAPAAFH